ncbi:MAG TPA: hypothetical protein VMI93_08105, partial [Candidatus Solibacter sp.]|nr:hypothetical protein [Candidatus Solibacter sp.]
AAAGIEGAGIFHDAEGGFDGIDAPAALAEDCGAGFGGAGYGRAARIGLLGRVPLVVARAAVDYEDKVVPLLLRHWVAMRPAIPGSVGGGKDQQDCGEEEKAA